MSHRRKDQCQVSGKHRFRDKREAVEALHKASNARKRAAEEGVECRRREVRSYRCRACHGWHLTSLREYSLAA